MRLLKNQADTVHRERQQVANLESKATRPVVTNDQHIQLHQAAAIYSESVNGSLAKGTPWFLRDYPPWTLGSTLFFACVSHKFVSWKSQYILYFTNEILRFNVIKQSIGRRLRTDSYMSSKTENLYESEKKPYRLAKWMVNVFSVKVADGAAMLIQC